MKKIPFTGIILAISAVLWLASMFLIYKNTYHNNSSNTQEAASSDVIFNNQEKNYYSISIDGKILGYRSESWIKNGRIFLCLEENVIKLNQAGLSREVYFQSVAGIDSTDYKIKNMRFTIGSGDHSSSFEAGLTGDSLKIRVKNSALGVTRPGIFIIDNDIIYPSVLPFYFHKSQKNEMSFMVFDPCFFNHYVVQGTRKGQEKIKIDKNDMECTRYDYEFLGQQGTMWLDSAGRLMKSKGYSFFGGRLGKIEIEKSTKQNIFLLPLEVKIGDNQIRGIKIYPDKQIENPREVSFMEVKLEGIRAANIDVLSSNKILVSANPVVFQIYNKPIKYNERKDFEIKNAEKDTMNLGTSDYINPFDARIVRLAGTIIKSESDTLKKAIAINKWVYENMKKDKDVQITRSVDILYDLKGGCDEFTKIFTALSRSVGIRTEIRMGLVYDNGCFVYHSWPGVFSEGNWHDLDPYYGQNEADATHITLIRGEFDSAVELLRVLFEISLKVMSYR